VAANHRSFLDPFVIGVTLPWRRPLHYVAKVELFEKRWHGWILSRLGAYPIRRGEADEETLITSRDPRARRRVCIFPEWHPDRTGSLGPSRSGASAGSLETGRGAPGGRAWHRAGARLADTAEEGQGIRMAGADLPAHRGSLSALANGRAGSGR
jgi:1-acyl-sn-glycerol-3-phosphate acyltransferase